LRGVNTFKPITLGEKLFHPDFLPYIKKSYTVFADICSGPSLSMSVFKQVPWHLFGCLAAAQSQLTLRTPYLDNDLVGLMYQASAFSQTSLDVSTRLIVDGNPALFKIQTDMGHGGEANLFFSKFNKILHWLTFKMDYYYNEGLPHWLAKFEDPLSKINLEKYIIGNHKYLHYRKWFRKDLAFYAKEILTDRSTVERPYWNKKLEKIIIDHINGHANNINEINMVLTVELIHRLLLEA
jgi:asparagine synthase (glutamine-hydrolysing)